MSESNKQYKIDHFDFGFSSQSKSGKRKKTPEKQAKRLDFASIIKSFIVLYKYIRATFKIIISIFSRVKWKVSRSIFLGRGVYFKYISNLSILIIIVFGSFVYLGLESSQDSRGFISKFSNVSSAKESVLFSAGGQTVLNQKQFSVVKYVVNGGDTLSSIAQKFSSSDNIISVDTIMWANGLKESDILRTGTVLDIPPVQGTMHTVKKGDSVIGIAKTYGRVTDSTAPEQILGVTQEITDINLLDVSVEGDKRNPVLVEGQRIIIPGGVMPQPVAVVPAPIKKPPVAAAPAPAPVVAPVTPGVQFIWPVISGRGLTTQYYSKWHTAIDIADASGPSLVAISSGRVTSAGWQSGGGANVVTIQFDNGFSALYAHMASFSVRTGDRVVQGQVIGRMGCSGACTGTHVHFSLFNNGAVVNPISYVRR
jgi:murein DD-endopeptidase MepM/ murein hydrolase activator NlpD